MGLASIPFSAFSFLRLTALFATSFLTRAALRVYICLGLALLKIWLPNLLRLLSQLLRLPLA